jgi:hypothetical protein
VVEGIIEFRAEHNFSAFAISSHAGLFRQRDVPIELPGFTQLITAKIAITGCCLVSCCRTDRKLAELEFGESAWAAPLRDVYTLHHAFAFRFLNRGVDIVTVQQLLGYSAITIPMPHTHTNLDSKHAAVAKLYGFGDNLVAGCTKMSQSTPRLSLNAL